MLRYIIFATACALVLFTVAAYAETLTKKRMELTIIWDREDPAQLQYRICAETTIASSLAPDGVGKLPVCSEWATMTRAVFRGLNGSQIETNAHNAINQAILNLGTGGHTAANDLGN